MIPSPTAVTFSTVSNSTLEPTDKQLTQLIEQGTSQVKEALASAFALAFDSLGTIELPPGAEARVDRAQMRAFAALYLAADLEPAGIFSAVENLAALAASGSLQADLGPVATPLHAFWRNRNNRVTRDERLAFFGRLFGASYGAWAATGTNNQFETYMLALCESLYQLGDGIHRNPHGGISNQTRIRTAARNLIHNLVSAGGGATPFMAQEIMNGLKEALAIVKHPHLQGVFGARDIWGVVERINRLAQSPILGNPKVFVSRGQAGMHIITWLAEAAGRLRIYGAPLVANNDQVISASVEWLQASLTIGELQASLNQSQNSSQPVGVSDWAELGL